MIWKVSHTNREFFPQTPNLKSAKNCSFQAQFNGKSCLQTKQIT